MKSQEQGQDLERQSPGHNERIRSINQAMLTELSRKNIVNVVVDAGADVLLALLFVSSQPHGRNIMQQPSNISERSLFRNYYYSTSSVRPSDRPLDRKRYTVFSRQYLTVYIYIYIRHRKHLVIWAYRCAVIWHILHN